MNINYSYKRTKEGILKVNFTYLIHMTIYETVNHAYTSAINKTKLP